jgi:hypothetical protein
MAITTIARVVTIAIAKKGMTEIYRLARDLGDGEFAVCPQVDLRIEETRHWL